MYRPKKAYEITLIAKNDNGHCAVSFSELPDELTLSIFQAMGFRKFKNSLTLIAEKEEPESSLEFAQLMQKSLKQGEYPEYIPYKASFFPDEANIKGSNFSIATIHFSTEKGETHKEERLFFERYSVRKHGIARAYALVRYADQNPSVSVADRPSKKLGMALLHAGDYDTSFPEPFGSFRDQKEGYEVKDGDRQSIINEYLEREVTKRSSSDFLKNHVVIGSLPKEETEARNQNDVHDSEQLPTEKSVTQKSETHFDDVQKSTTQKSVAQKSVTLFNEEKPENTEKFTTQKSVTHLSDAQKSVTQKSVAHLGDEKDDSILYKENFLFLNKLIPDLEEALFKQVEYSESLSEESKFKEIRFRRTSDLENDLVDISLELIPKKPRVINRLELWIRLNLSTKEGIVTQWVAREIDEKDSEIQDYKQSDLVKLIEELLSDGHLFALMNEIPEGESTTGETIEEGSLIPLQQIYLMKGKEFKGYAEFDVFDSWEKATEWLEQQQLQIDEENSFFYIIEWKNGYKIGASFDLFEDGFHPQFDDEILQRVAVRHFIKRHYSKQGRFSSSGSTYKTDKEENHLAYLTVLELGLSVDRIIAEYQPRVPIVELDIITEADFSNESFRNARLINRANSKLELLKIASSSEDSVTIKVRWKDGFTISTSIKFNSIPHKVNAAFWSSLIVSKSDLTKNLKYQVDDDDPILLPNELEIKPPKFYYEKLMPAYWYSSDKDRSQRIVFTDWVYHLTELAALIQSFLQGLDDEDENDLIELRKTSSSWMAVVDFLIEYKKLSKDDKNLQLEVIRTLIEKAANKNDESSRVTLLGLLVRIRSEETLKDLPPRREKTAIQSTKPETKNESKRIEHNREIEALLHKFGTERLKYSENDFEKIAQYSGYGGSKLSEINKGLLYEYYTPEAVIKLMWGLAIKHGYQSGSILEPSCGTGKFLKYAPKSARIEGYEINKYSAQIAQLLYPHAKIYQKSFENLFFNGNIYLKGKFRTEAFDLVIGNPPYGSFSGKYAGMGEKKRTKAFTYDQYFLLKGIDLLKEGGLLVFVIPQSFIDNDKKYTPLKEKLFSKAEQVEARRLYNGVFQHTEVGTDIVVLRKKKSL